jgi:redox-sensitive bicupin YhaK (pirin superfamily)
VMRGTVRVNGIDLAASDGLAVSQEEALTVQATQPAEVMLFDLP